MDSTCMNDVKIYNLSSGKSAPDWLSAKKRKKAMKHDVQMRNRIELIQNFEMPGVSDCILLSPDEQYIVVTGSYKPRFRCYDTKELAMKFERCFDSEAIKVLFLSHDWTKPMFLQHDRWIELHNQSGRYFRIRIPKAGHDMGYLKSTADVYVVGQGRDINRLNLEQGKFQSPLVSECTNLNTVTINEDHELILTGSKEGIIEGWDHRVPKRVARLDCALSSVTMDTNVDGLPAVTSVTFKDPLHVGVGMSTGQILLYDLRCNKPILVKDHYYGLPIKKVTFIPALNCVGSIDEKILKIWHENDGSPYTAIQPESDINDVCIIPGSGVIFMANEDKKVLSYYVPSLGPAPKWATHLDNMVEELEDTTDNTVYDDYKFVTQSELMTLNLGHLMGTSLLRAYMHGYFLDIRLYNKSMAASQPVQYDSYKKDRIKHHLELETANRVHITSALPQVNRNLAEKLMLQQGIQVDHGDEGDSDHDGQGDDVEQIGLKSRSRASREKKKMATTLLSDDRFKIMFQNKDFEVDESSDVYKLVNHHKERDKDKKTKSRSGHPQL